MELLYWIRRLMMAVAHMKLLSIWGMRDCTNFSAAELDGGDKIPVPGGGGDWEPPPPPPPELDGDPGFANKQIVH
jgi:hypothetical protein